MDQENKFGAGRRWRVNTTDETKFKRCYPFDFVIVGPPHHYSKKTAVRCTLEVVGHTQKCHTTCSHGVTQDYPRKHLEKHATLLPVPPHDCPNCTVHACDCGACKQRQGLHGRRPAGKCSCGTVHCCYAIETANVGALGGSPDLP